MTGFYITKLRLVALDFPGQIALFTNLKNPVYFRNSTLEYIQSGGWAELPEGHFTAFMAALKDGWVRGERSWHLDYHQFTRRWRVPGWVSEDLSRFEAGVSSERFDTYISRCKSLLDQGVVQPIVNYPQSTPPQIITYILASLEKQSPEDQLPDFYSVIARNLEDHPNKEVAHRAFNLLAKKTQANYRFAQIDILNDLSKMNPEDREVFMSWLFKSPKHLEKIKEANYIVGDIIMKAVEQGEVWYVEKPRATEVI